MCQEAAQAWPTAFLGGPCRHTGPTDLNGLAVLVLAHGHDIHPSSAHTLVVPVIAESDSPDDFDHLVTRAPKDLSQIRPLVPQLQAPGDDRAFALAAVQATVFPGRGLCLDVSVHHAAYNGAPRPSSAASTSAVVGGPNTDGDGVIPAAAPPDRPHQGGCDEAGAGRYGAGAVEGARGRGGGGGREGPAREATEEVAEGAGEAVEGVGEAVEGRGKSGDRRGGEGMEDRKEGFGVGDFYMRAEWALTGWAAHLISTGQMGQAVTGQHVG
ncbi:uncharacterized protein LOC105914558 [Setaria italica]|uniref:uncharacterized protein LOC105914558 n=1 Tax=Setaria italica TaxID=4555 RepID=UPI00064567C7|nr:uncharacterized protein LOC105914558 [Setaria italica]